MDRSYLYGDGLFETVRVEDGRVHRLDRHVARFVRSARSLGFTDELIGEAVAELEAIAPDPDGLVRVTVSRTPEGAPFGGTGGVTVFRRPLPEAARPRLVTLSGWYLPEDPLAGFKTTSYMRWVEARRIAHMRNGDDAVMISSDGLVGETSTSNLFVRFGDRLVTPDPKGVLPGVTRAAVIDSAKSLGLEIEERFLSLKELWEADEVICTSSGVLAVAAHSIDQVEFGGDVAPRIREALRRGWP